MSKPIHLLAPSISRFGGGITEFSRQLATALQFAGFRLHLLGKHDFSKDWNQNRLTGAGSMPTMLRTPYYSMQAVTAALTEHPCEVVSTHLNFGPLARLMKRLTGAPFTLVVHGIDVHPGLSAQRIAALRSADRLIAVSRWTRDQLLALGGIQPDRVTILPNTYDNGRFTVTQRPAHLLERYRIRSDEKIILTVGRLDPGERYKGYDQVLKALPSIRQAFGAIRYMIVGRGADRDRIESLAKELRVDDLVIFTGFVSDAELPDHYRLADVFAMPSTGEGFGIVFLESMGCGTPVLAGNIEGSVDALMDGRLGVLVDPHSTPAVTAGVISLLKREGPAWWYDRPLLSSEVSKTFGRAAFCNRVKALFQLTSCAE